ncbi:hypothetical protein HMPREF9440_01952 [Sutterella parvirubra YIT 11816]|uniref:Uncharacterized protein n=1 Tax=Sutterella parvirubra YIT 11816 TaxID=762967 RepID=H3KGS0_9BURK|nr:hypothetical protein HMPREF9440_01952 [Sutterella parvirubra YIT 11816]
MKSPPERPQRRGRPCDNTRTGLRLGRQIPFFFSHPRTESSARRGPHGRRAL